MKKRTTVILVAIMMLVLIMGTALVVILVNKGKNGEAIADSKSFSSMTDVEVFQNIPAMLVEGAGIGEFADYGEGVYVVDVNGTNLSDYEAYLTTLEKAGFKRYVDNGETGLDETVYTASFTKDELVVTVIQVVSNEKTYISAYDNYKLSEHLHYDESYVAGNEEGAETTFHMLELWDCGNSFVIQLKNGHFIVNDGGINAADLKYLLDYLESLTPAGEKPVVEAWFVSHPHSDHVGAMAAIMTEDGAAERLYVDGIYFNMPNNKVFTTYDSESFTMASYVKAVANMLMTSKGGMTKLYRPQTGQRYYFNDITVDILHTQEQLKFADYQAEGGINDASTWLMYTIDEQKVLLSGDADIGSVDVVMNTYESDYFDLDVFVVFHHGINVWDKFTDYVTYKTVLYPNYRVGSSWADNGNAYYSRAPQNQYLISKAAEGYGFGDGTVVLTFPYAVGTGEVTEAADWSKYSTEERTFKRARQKEYATYIQN